MLSCDEPVAWRPREIGSWIRLYTPLLSVTLKPSSIGRRDTSSWLGAPAPRLLLPCAAPRLSRRGTSMAKLRHTARPVCARVCQATGTHCSVRIQICRQQGSRSRQAADVRRFGTSTPLEGNPASRRRIRARVTTRDTRRHEHSHTRRSTSVHREVARTANQVAAASRSWAVPNQGALAREAAAAARHRRRSARHGERAGTGAYDQSDQRARQPP
jgi:hypothetical protein